MHREKRARLREEAQHARKLWSEQNYTEGMASLLSLQAEFLGEAEVAKLLEAVREEQAEQRKQQRLAEARNLLAAKRFEECLMLLGEFQAKFPGEAEVAKLLEAVREEQAEQLKRAQLAEARALLAAKCFDECAVLLTGLQNEFPTEVEAARLLEAVQQTRAEQQKLTDARTLLRSQRYSEALAILDALLELHPNDPAVRKLRKLVVQEQEESAALARLQSEREALKKLVSEEKYSEAIARAEELLQNFPRRFRAGATR